MTSILSAANDVNDAARPECVLTLTALHHVDVSVVTNHVAMTSHPCVESREGATYNETWIRLRGT